MDTVVSKQINRLQQLYATGFQNPFLDTAVDKIIRYQVNQDKADLQRIQKAMARFEKQYGMDSSQFWTQYQAGQLADTDDFMEWNALCKMQRRIQQRLDILRGEKVR
ncbi:MAG: hypothetical protein HF973_02515 [Chloroflexi bacterium]|nr:hypothetical protein [Chloroflexota bacterium]